MILALLPLGAETDLVLHGGSGKAKVPSEEAVCFGSSAGSWSQDSECPARASCLLRRHSQGWGDASKLLQHHGSPTKCHVLGRPQAGGCLPLCGGELLEWDVHPQCTLRPHFSGVCRMCERCVSDLPLWNTAFVPGRLTWNVGWNLGNVTQLSEQGEFGESGHCRGMRAEQRLSCLCDCLACSTKGR